MKRRIIMRTSISGKLFRILTAAFLSVSILSPVYAEETGETESEWQLDEEPGISEGDELVPAEADASINAGTATITMQAAYYQDEARSILPKINAFRTGNETWAWNSDNSTKTWYTGLSGLYYDYELEKVAMQRAAEIGIVFDYNHKRPDGSDYKTAYPSFFSSGWRVECIAIGYGSADAAFNRWKEDNYDYVGQIHRRVMLNSALRAVGIACCQCNGSMCWVMEFSSIYVSNNAVSYDTNYRNVNINIPSDSVSMSGGFASSKLEKDPNMIVEIGYPVNIPNVNAELYHNGWTLYKPAIGTTVKSSDTSVLKVENGKLVAVKPGKATVTIDKTCGSYRISRRLNVQTRNHVHDFRFTWMWADDYSSASADYVCTVDAAHAGSGEAVVTSVRTEPLCYQDGSIVYTATLNIEGKDYTSERYVALLKTNDHDYGEPVFEWADDRSTATASVICAHGHEELKETVPVSYEVIKEPTESEPGTGRLVAEFENEVFGTQYQEIEIPALTAASPVSFAIAENSLNLLYDASQTLRTTVSPAGASPEIIWTSSNMEVASVDTNGKVTALRAGTTEIKAYTLYGQSDTCTVRVMFTDVADSGRYYFDPVYWAADNNITVGHGGHGRFSPEWACTREQIVTFLWRLMGEPEPETYQEFPDVRSTDWYFKPISWAASQGITVGLNDGTGRFGVGMPCTREMCVTFLYRAAGSPYYSGWYNFRDVAYEKYYYEPINWAASKGITVGLNDGTGRFGVGQSCTRAMIVTFLRRYAEL